MAIFKPVTEVAMWDVTDGWFRLGIDLVWLKPRDATV